MPHPLETLYQRLFTAYGPQNWWPAETPFEMMLGAILTQNTAWTNVEKALFNLKQAQALNLTRLLELPESELAELIRPSGYFNLKAKRLKHFANAFKANGKFKQLDKLETEDLRKNLLAINGIGPETADDILLYAFKRPVFVIDTYTRRLLSATGLQTEKLSYESLRAWFEESLSPDVNLYNEYHALIVRHAKEKCQKNMACKHCKVEQVID